VIDTEMKCVRYAGAGHPPLLVRSARSGESSLVLENGLFLGYFPEAEYSAAETPFEEGDWVVLYTDGIPETMNEADEQFGRDRLKAFLDEHSGLAAGDLADHLLGHLTQWSGAASGDEADDDMTLVAVHFRAGE